MMTFREILTSEKVQYVLLAFGLYWAWVAASTVVFIAVVYHVISSFIIMNISIFKPLFVSGSMLITSQVSSILKGISSLGSASVSSAGKATADVPQSAGVQPGKKPPVSRSSNANRKIASSAHRVKTESANGS